MIYVAYLRVSTKKQKRSGLGLQAQRDIIKHYSAIDKAEIVKEFIEYESGKDIHNRKVLSDAIKFCKDNAYTLVVAKLDRLSRDVEHIFKIHKHLSPYFKSFDLPNTDSLTLSIFAGLAQRERELIAIRTKAALKAKKAAGATLGKPSNFSDEGRRSGANTIRQRAISDPQRQQIIAFATQCRSSGMTFEQTAYKLNTSGFKTKSGKLFFKSSVQQLLR